jgi:hypothetical protein
VPPASATYLSSQNPTPPSLDIKRNPGESREANITLVIASGDDIGDHMLGSDVAHACVDEHGLTNTTMVDGTALGVMPDRVEESEGGGDMDMVMSDHAVDSEAVGSVIGSDATPARIQDSLDSALKDVTMTDDVIGDPQRLVAGLEGRQFPVDAETLYWPALGIHTFLPWLHKQTRNSPVSRIIITNAPLFISV